MKRTSLLATALLALGLVFTATGCATFSKSTATAKQRGTFALIASVSGGTAPTDAQWATMQKNFAALLASRGLTLVTDPSEAEKLIQVLFVPDLADSSTGISYVVGVRNNPGSILSPSPRASVASYSYTNLPGFNNFGQPQYYGYYNDYPDYSSGSSVAAPSSGSPTTPPAHHDGGHHVSRPVDCPPETSGRPSPGYAGNHPSPSNPGGSGNHWWNSRPSSESSSSYSSHSSPSYSSSSSYSSPSYSSSSDYVGPTTSYSSSSSNSSPSISFSSSSSSSYSAPMSSSSSSDSPRSFATAPQDRPE